MSGPRVLITRASGEAERLTSRLAQLGYEAVEAPLLELWWEVEALIAAANAEVFQGVVVTSPTAAQVLAVACPGWSGPIAAVGPTTAQALTDLGYAVSHVAPGGTAKDLADSLPAEPGQRWLYPHSDLADPAFVEALRARDLSVEAVVAYRNRPVEDAAQRLRAALPVAATLLLSGSAAARLAGLVEDRQGLGQILAIGPATEAAARQAGLAVHQVAARPTLGDLLATLQRRVPAPPRA
jgi:uroporphyrinogen-III synthase